MESANLHHHQHHQLKVQDQLVIGSSSLPTTPSFFGIGSTLSWTPNTIMNPSHFSSSIGNGVNINSRDQNDIPVPSLNNSSMIQDMEYQWANSNNIGNEGLSYPYSKFTEMMINHSSSPSSSSSNTQDFELQQSSISYMKNLEGELSEMGDKLLLRNFSAGCQIDGLQFQAGTSTRGSFSQILPTVNISNLNQSPKFSISSSLDMNMQPLDLFTSNHRFPGCLNPAASNRNLSFHKDSGYYGLDDHVQQSPRLLSNSSSNKISTFSNGVSEAKRPPNTLLEPKVPQSAPKKSRSDSRASCPPIKVRKEKLTDRIAVLQHLVAPFGKTDTASVLMEAIGYIKFLQNQVETLSVPYMKSSCNRTSSRTIRGGSVQDGKRDLKSRGLCLVPLTCLSYVTDGGGGVWPPPNFG